MTYQQLFDYLKTLDHNQMKMDVSIYDIGGDEFYPVEGFHLTITTDVLDDNHPYIAY